VTADQIIPAAIIAVVLILVIAGIVRIAARRRGSNEDTFGAGGVTRVPVGTTGVSRTDLAPSGVVYLLGEEWTARSRTGAAISMGSGVRVVGHDGLALIVDGEPAAE
jgi:membrane-bound ClpP family serine protease